MLRILISYSFTQTIHLYQGSVLVFHFILLSAVVFPFITMLGKLGQTSELYILFVVTLISVSECLSHKPAAEKTVCHAHGSSFDV